MHNSNYLEEQWELTHPDISRTKQKFVESYTVWEFVVNDRTLHLFTTEEAAYTFANSESVRKALNFLAPGAKITIHEISVMELQ